MPARPKFFKNCPVCNAETPRGVTHCPGCGVDLEIARVNLMKGIVIEGGKIGYAAGRTVAPPPTAKKAITLSSVIGWVVGCFLLLLVYGIIKDTILMPIMYPSLAPTSSYQASLPTPKPGSLTQMAQALTPSDELECFRAIYIEDWMANKGTGCVFGTVVRVQEYQGATQLRFGTDQQFFFSSGSIYYPDIGAGDCVYAKGEILLSAEGVPYIDIDKNDLYLCEPWMVTP